MTVLTPAEVEVVSQERTLPEELVLAAKKPGRHMICACLKTTGPLHYTLLCMQREADSQWQLRYYDTLPSPSQSAYEKSRQLLKLVLETAKADSQGLPAPCNLYKQASLVGSGSCSIWKKSSGSGQERQHRPRNRNRRKSQTGSTGGSSFC